MAAHLKNALSDSPRSPQAVSPDSATKVVHQGWLAKKGNFSRRWKQLYFVLWSDGSLIGYESEPGNPPQKPSHRYVIRRRRIEACNKVNQSGNYKFHIRGAPGTFIINRTFGTATCAWRNLWLNALTQVVQEVTPWWNVRRRVSPFVIEDYEILSLIGHGSFGKVDLCRKRTTGKLYALKTVSKLTLPQNSDVSVYSEKDILAKNNHPFLTKLCCWFQSDVKLFLVMEYANGGSLSSHLRRNRRLKQRDACFYAAQVASGIGYLHSHRVIYRDLKPENILIATDGYIKLVDFGLAKKMDDVEGTARYFCGTLNYVAPEVVHSWDYGRAVDWWSLGIIVFEMLTGRTPFKRSTENATTRSIMFDPVEYPHYVSHESRCFITALLQKNPSPRLGSNKADYVEVERHSFFMTIDRRDLLNKKIRPPFVPALTSDDDTRYFENIARHPLPH